MSGQTVPANAELAPKEMAPIVTSTRTGADEIDGTDMNVSLQQSAGKCLEQFLAVLQKDESSVSSPVC
jgi:hypothetical protein